MKKVTIHKNCGGRVANYKCEKCGKTWKKFKYLVTSEVETVELKFDEREYKKRIREMRDIR